MYPSTMVLDDDGDDDPFAGEELLDLEALVQKKSKKGIEVAPYADTDTYHCLDPADPDWRETYEMRLSQLTKNNKTKTDETEIEIGLDSDGGSDDASLPIPAVQTVKEALDLVLQTQIAEFANYQGWEELSSAVTKVSDIFVDLRLETQKQSSILDFMEKCFNVTE